MAPTTYSPSTKAYLDGLFGRHHAEAAAVADRLPNCIIVGAAKSGTTSLAATLGRHRQIFTCRPKEPKFFGPEYAHGWEWYGSLFEKGAQHKIRIDASTMYGSADPLYLGTAKLISTYIPDARIIYLARNPLERTVSHWRHWMGRHPKRFGPFDTILDRARDRRLFVECSMYNARIAPYRDHFPKAHILCLTFEDMISDPRAFLTCVFNFLGVQRHDRILERLLPDGQFRQENSAGSQGRELVPKPEWSDGPRQAFVDLVGPDARAFLRSIGKPEDYWDGV